MKILWFTNTPSKASVEFGYTSFGGGWISALETILVEQDKHQLGICFFYPGAEYKKVEKGNVVYYGIPLQKQNALQRIVNRHKGVLNDNAPDFIDEVINDFKPALIHVFGTEMGYGKLLINKFQKVVFHLQGLVAPYSEVYFPPGFTKKQAFLGGSIGDILRGLTFYNHYAMFKASAKRELEIMRSWKYFTGRTDWDRNYTLLINPGANYFHCEELLRAAFFDNEWKPLPIGDTQKKVIVIGTTINPNIYKGLDLIYKVVPLLKDYDVKWKLFGINEDSGLNRLIKKHLQIRDIEPAIQFYGQTGSTELITELQSCHFFVHPSYIDNSPNSVCEAMLLGMPILSSSVGGVSSLITHGETGYLFNPHDKYDLAGMIAYLANHYDDAIACGAKARLLAQRRHNPKAILAVLNSIYNSISHD